MGIQEFIIICSKWGKFMKLMTVKFKMLYVINIIGMIARNLEFYFTY